MDLTPTSNMPEQFEEIHQNIYVSRKKRTTIKEEDVYECNCNPLTNKRSCGIGCLNRMHSAECNPNYCLLGDRCLNRRFQNREWANVEIKVAGNKGWGLFAKENIKKYDFIMEYVGEIIGSTEVKQRLRVNYCHSKKFFILSIGGGYSIDATVKGSKARFMNHSCSPNCATQKWTVLGEISVGFFALRDITIGEEITFDYQFQRYGEGRHPCYCGENNCRKFLGSSPNKTINKKHTQQQKQPQIKQILPVIIYRKMNGKVQLRRHAIYLKHLWNYQNNKNNNNENNKIDNNYFTKQIFKGMICNKLQLISKTKTNSTSKLKLIKYNNYDINYVQKYYEFDNILHNMRCQNKEFNMNEIISMSRKLNSLKILNNNNILQVNKLYGDCISDINGDNNCNININHQKTIKKGMQNKHKKIAQHKNEIMKIRWPTWT